jgi:hypothetical protein
VEVVGRVTGEKFILYLYSEKEIALELRGLRIRRVDPVQHKSSR